METDRLDGDGVAHAHSSVLTYLLIMDSDDLVLLEATGDIAGDLNVMCFI